MKEHKYNVGDTVWVNIKDWTTDTLIYVGPAKIHNFAGRNWEGELGYLASLSKSIKDYFGGNIFIKEGEIVCKV